MHRPSNETAPGGPRSPGRQPATKQREGKDMQGDDEVLRTATSKAIRRIVPFTMLMFVLSFLDRVNVGFAKQGLQRDAGIGDYAFAMGLSLFFIGYALFETPSNVTGAKPRALRLVQPVSGQGLAGA